MKFMLYDYLNRIKLDKHIMNDESGLFLIHKAHFYNVPFENFDMYNGRKYGLDLSYLIDKIVYQKRGGVCYELNKIIAKAFDEMGFEYNTCLSRVHCPALTSATHQVFIVRINGEKWLFDVGFGAKGPRAPLLLIDGYTHKHPYHLTKIMLDEKYGWTVSVKENLKTNAEWEIIYSFYDQLTTNEDIDMAYFFTFNSPNNLLNKNKVISIPLDNGRISVRNNIFTEAGMHYVESYELDGACAVRSIINSRFGIDVGEIEQ